MKLFNRDRSESSTEAEVAAPLEEQVTKKGYTAPKAKPTPKRSVAQGARGPVPPPPTTQREAMKRSRGDKDARRAAAAERRQRMADGDDRVLLPRDRGPVRAYVRDVVDAKRNLVGLFMPMAILIFVALFLPMPQVQQIATLACTVLLALMLIEGIVNGMSIVKKVRAKFPEASDRGVSLGWYAFVRGSQIRKLRVPKPRVKPGAKIT